MSTLTSDSNQNSQSRTARPEVPRQRAVEAGSVAVTDACLRIEGATVIDADVLRSASTAEQRGRDLNQWLTATLRLGAIAGEAASSGADLQKVQAAMDGLATRLDAVVTAATTSLSGALSDAVDADTGQLAVASQRAVDRLATGIGRLIHENGELPRSVRAAVGQVTDEVLREVTRAVATHSETVKAVIGQDRHAVKDAVLAALQTQHADLVATVTELRAALAQQQAVATAIALNTRRNSADGFALERDCGAVLSRIAAHAGDGGSTPVGAMRGDANTKKGDHLVAFTSLHPTEPPRLVVEIKNRTARPLSTQEWRQELDAARENRSAVVAMGVTPPEHMPVAGERLVVLDADTLLVAWGPGDDTAGEAVLTAAYLLLRMSAARALHNAGDVTPGLVRRRLEEVQAALVPLTQLDRSVTAGRKALDDIEAIALRVKDDTTGRLKRMHDDLSG